MNWRTLLHKLASVTVLRLGVAAMGFALFWLLSHELPAAELGGFSVWMNTFLLLQALPLLGLNVHVIRELAAHPEQQAQELSHATAFALFFGGLMTLGVVAYGVLGADNAMRSAYVLLGLALLPSAWVLVVESALIGREQLPVLTAVTMAESLCRVLGAALSLACGWGLTGVFAFFLAGRLLTCALYLGFGGLPAPSRRLVSRAGLRRYLHLAPTYLAIGLVSVASSRIDVLLLSRLRGLSDVGVYAAAAKLYEASLMVSTMALMIVYPVLSRLFVQDRAAFAAMLGRCVRWGLLIGPPLVMLGMALAQPLVHLLYAPRLWGAAPVLQVLLFAAWLMAMDQLLSSTMLAAQAQRHDLRAMVAGLITLLVLLFLLCPWLGPVGTAWAVVAGLGLRVGWRLRWAEDDLGLAGLLGQSARAALAAVSGVAVFLLMGSGVWMAPGHPVLQALLALLAGGLTHAGLSWVTGAFGPAHRADWSAWRRKATATPEALA